MPSFTTLNTAVSGMRVAQAGLAVTGHNMANAEIGGFSRQRTIQKEFFTRGIGTGLNGMPLRVGTGADTGNVHQIRSAYFDMLYRKYNTRLHFYSVRAAVGHHIETVLGETEGSYRFQQMLVDLHNSMHELNTSIAGPSERDFFIGTAIAFIEKAQNVFEELYKLQRNLDGQIREMVADINNIVAEVERLNRAIAGEEFSGDKANDLRDERNRLLDQLSGFIPITVSENHVGRVDILTMNGHFLLHSGVQNTLGLVEICGWYGFVEPVFTRATSPLPADTPPDRYMALFNWRRPIDARNGNDQGALMALLQTRGAMPATYRGIEALWNPAMPTERPAVPWPAPPDPTNTVLFPLGAADPAFSAALAAYNALWAPYTGLPNYTGPIPPDPADFITAAYPTGYENPAFTPAFLMYMLERQNDLNNFERLFPLAVIDPAAFNAAVLAGTGPVFNQLMGAYHAARRTYDRAAWSKEHALVPRVMMEMDQVVNAVVRLINDSVAPILNHQRCPDAPFDLNGARSFTEVFVRKQMPRFIGGGFAEGIHNPGMGGNRNSLYTTRNLMINPELLRSGGYNLLALSLSADNDDTRVVQTMIDRWRANDGPHSIEITRRIDGQLVTQRFSIEEAYQIFITQLATELNETNTFLGSQFRQTVQADERRNRIMGVSMDEELTNMMTYQFAYQAAARLFNIIDSMIDTLINRTGRVGL